MCLPQEFIKLMPTEVHWRTDQCATNTGSKLTLNPPVLVMTGSASEPHKSNSCMSHTK